MLIMSVFKQISFDFFFYNFVALQTKPSASCSSKKQHGTEKMGTTSNDVLF